MEPSSFAGEPRAGRIRSMCATPTMGVHKWFRVESTDCPQHDLVPAQELFGIEQSHRNRVSGTITMGIRSRRRTQKKDDESKKKKRKTRHWLGQLVCIKVHVDLHVWLSASLCVRISFEKENKNTAQLPDRWPVMV